MRPTSLVRTARRLSQELQDLRFEAPVTHVYNPLDYAWAPHRAYLERYGRGSREVLLVGMNPGPFGMAQTGVPFGEVTAVRDWLGIEARVERPADEHPKRAVLGFDCPRREVSGQRLWGWVRSRFDRPADFFGQFFVYNYCPLAFFEVSGRNRTPDKLPAAERVRLFTACDRALRRVVQALRPRYVVGIGQFAEQRVRVVLPDFEGVIGRLLHPSPASPLANRGWAPQADRTLAKLGIEIPGL